MATSILLKFLTLEWDISRTIWRIEVSEGSFVCIFRALSFELNLFFEWSCPLSLSKIIGGGGGTPHRRILLFCKIVYSMHHAIFC